MAFNRPLVNVHYNTVQRFVLIHENVLPNVFREGKRLLLSTLMFLKEIFQRKSARRKEMRGKNEEEPLSPTNTQ
jgi:hypothetical protein